MWVGFEKFLSKRNWMDQSWKIFITEMIVQNVEIALEGKVIYDNSKVKAQHFYSLIYFTKCLFYVFSFGTVTYMHSWPMTSPSFLNVEKNHYKPKIEKNPKS